MSKVCYIMVGVPGSGKSTIISEMRKMIHGSDDVFVFSSDDCLVRFYLNSGDRAAISKVDAELYTTAFKHMTEHDKEFKELLEAEWQRALTHDVLFVDRTNMTKKSRARWIQDARSKKFEIVGMDVHTPFDICIARQNTRGKFVPEQIIRDMWDRKQELTVGEVDRIMHAAGFDL